MDIKTCIKHFKYPIFVDMFNFFLISAYFEKISNVLSK